MFRAAVAGDEMKGSKATKFHSCESPPSYRRMKLGCKRELGATEEVEMENLSIESSMLVFPAGIRKQVASPCNESNVTC